MGVLHTGDLAIAHGNVRRTPQRHRSAVEMWRSQRLRCEPERRKRHSAPTTYAFATLEQTCGEDDSYE